MFDGEVFEFVGGPGDECVLGVEGEVFDAVFVGFCDEVGGPVASVVLVCGDVCDLVWVCHGCSCVRWGWVRCGCGYWWSWSGFPCLVGRWLFQVSHSWRRSWSQSGALLPPLMVT